MSVQPLGDVHQDVQAPSAPGPEGVEHLWSSGQRDPHLASIKQHIAIVVHDFHSGGTEAIALRLAGEWMKAGRAVTVIAGSEQGPMRARVPRGAQVEVADPPVARTRFSRLRLGKALLPVLESVSPDLVFIPGNYHLLLSRPIRARFADLAVVAKVSNPLLPPMPAPLRWAAARVVRGNLAALDGLIFMSRELLAADADLAFPTRTTVIHEPNLPDDHAPLPRLAPQSPPLVLAVGRMEPQKNLALAIRAFARLHARRPARLMVLGEGPERASLEALVARLGLADAVQMPGFSSDVARHLSRASLLLMSARFEGYPAVLVEALAADVPVVSTDCSPAQRALISGPVHGEVVDEPTPEALALAMERVLDGPFASGGVRAHGLEKHRASVSAAAWLDLFDGICRPAATPVIEQPARWPTAAAWRGMSAGPACRPRAP
jgi:glycosyltransferase involved in cell wall biosynthesis